MRLTSIGRTRIATFLTIGVLVAAGVGYGCSDDDDDKKTTPTTTTDAGGGTDTGTTADTGGSKDTGTVTDTGTTVDAAVPTAVANITTTSDGGITGTATWVQGASGGATVTLTLTGAPQGTHGVHVHANGACGDLNDAGPGTAAGGHWNPADAGHAFPDGGMSHLGDMGNIEVGAGGTGTLTLTKTDWVVSPTSSTNSVVGHAIIIHANADDGTTQPTGNSGGRIGCGVIAQTK